MNGKKKLIFYTGSCNTTQLASMERKKQLKINSEGKQILKSQIIIIIYILIINYYTNNKIEPANPKLFWNMLIVKYVLFNTEKSKQNDNKMLTDSHPSFS